MNPIKLNRFLWLMFWISISTYPTLWAGHRQPASRLRPAQYLNPYHLKDVHIPTSLSAQPPSPTMTVSSNTSTTTNSPQSHPRHRYLSMLAQEHFPCRELIRQPMIVQNHCQCRRSEQSNMTELNCDHVSLSPTVQSLQLLPGLVLDSMLLRHAGLQMLPAQLFSASTANNGPGYSAVQLKQLDLCHNYLRRLAQRSFDGVEHSLEQLRLGHNLLGDQLNPIFATNEFFALSSLQLLDLSHNRLRALDSNLFAGLGNLTDLDLSGNEITSVPTDSILTLKSLRRLNLADNQILDLSTNAFPVHSLEQLNTLNMSGNPLQQTPSFVLDRLPSLRHLHLTNCQLKQIHRMTSLAEHGLQTLILSDNLLSVLPIDAWEGGSLRRLRSLNLAGNQITSVEEGDLSPLTSLQHLDLSHNRILSLAGWQVFHNLNQLRSLSLASNRLHRLQQAPSDLFQSQRDHLEILDLSDNQLTSFPAAVLSGLGQLRKLFLDHNRIDRLRSDHLRSLTQLDELSIAYNRLSELPEKVFSSLSNLRLLNLHANQISEFPYTALQPISDGLLALDIGFNDLRQLPSLHFPRLIILGLAWNRLTRLQSDHLRQLSSLRHLNLTGNHLNSIDVGCFQPLKQLEVLDISFNLLHSLPVGLFHNLTLARLSLRGNRIEELQLSTFEELHRLHTLDLGNNRLQTLRAGAFDELPHLRTLRLDRNRLRTLRGEIFTTRTNLETLDFEHNRISYLYPNSFVIHRRLRTLKLADNRLTYVPAEIFSRSIESIDLQRNRLHSLDNADFANMHSLHSLSLAGNRIVRVADGAFVNSSQLQELNLSDNQIEQLDARCFGGQLRLRLNLSHNRLSQLPIDLFHPKRVLELVELNLSDNQFTSLPVVALKKQHSWLQSLNVANNRIRTLPPNSDLLVNVKALDISNNPLTVDALRLLFTEPKSVRILNASNVDLGRLFNQLPSTTIAAVDSITSSLSIEMPFLRELDISHNQLTKLPFNALDRLSLLQQLDLSHNSLSNGNNHHLGHHWSKVPSLLRLHLQSNLLHQIGRTEFASLKSLQLLDLSRQPLLSHFECEVLGPLRQLRILHLTGYPHLRHIELQECFAQLSSKLEELSIELKLHTLQGHLQPVLSNRLRRLVLSGERLSSLAPQALNGWTSENTIRLELVNTSITTLQPEWLIDALPDSVHLQLQLIDSRRPLQLDRNSLQTLDERWSNIKLLNADKLQLHCDCSVEPLWRMARNRLLAATAADVISGISSDSMTDNNPSPASDSGSLDGESGDTKSDSSNSTDPLVLIDADYRSSFIENYLNLTCSGPASLIDYRLVDLELNEFLCNGGGGDDNLISASSHVSGGLSPNSSIVASSPVGSSDESRSDLSTENHLSNHRQVNRAKLIRNGLSASKEDSSESGLSSWSASTANPDVSTHDYNYELTNLHSSSPGHKLSSNRPSSRKSNFSNVIRGHPPHHHHQHHHHQHHSAVNNEIDLASADRQLVRPVTLTKVDTLIIGIAAAIVAFVGILMLLICVLKSKRSPPNHLYHHSSAGSHLHSLDAAMYAAAAASSSSSSPPHHHHHFSQLSPLRTPSLTGSCTCASKPGSGSPNSGLFTGQSMSGTTSVYNLPASAYTYTTTGGGGGGTLRAAMLSPIKR